MNSEVPVASDIDVQIDLEISEVTIIDIVVSQTEQLSNIITPIDVFVRQKSSLEMMRMKTLL